MVLAPIRGGSGTCIKVVEAALHGRRTIATPFAVRGLSKNDIDGLGMSVAETPADFLNALEMLFKEEEIATVQREIATRARVLNSISAFEECVRTAIADAVSGKAR